MDGYELKIFARDAMILAANKELADLRAQLAAKEEQLQVTHGQIAEMCKRLDPKGHLVPDAWGLRDSILVFESKQAALQARAKELEEALLLLFEEHTDCQYCDICGPAITALAKREEGK